MNCPNCNSPMQSICRYCGYHIAVAIIPTRIPDTIQSLVSEIRELMGIVCKRDLCESTNCHKCPLTKRALAGAETTVERALDPETKWTIENLQAMKRNLEADIPSMAHR